MERVVQYNRGAIVWHPGLRLANRARRGWGALALGAALVCSLAVACGNEEAADPSIREPSESPPPPAARPLRVVSLSPTATTFVLDLGAGSQLVAVDAASARLPGAEALPVVDLVGVTERPADIVLIGSDGAEDTEAVDRLRALDVDVVEVAPNDFDGVFALCRGLGARLVGAARATAFERQIGSELAMLAAEARDRPRPRVAAVVGLDPIVLAGAHSFETDLIELAGGTSTTHAHDVPTGPVSAAKLISMTPDLVIVVSRQPLSEAERVTARAAIGEMLAVGFFVLDRQRFWVRNGPEAVRRLQDLIAREMGR